MIREDKANIVVVIWRNKKNGKPSVAHATIPFETDSCVNAKKYIMKVAKWLEWGWMNGWMDGPIWCEAYYRTHSAFIAK